MTFDAILVCSGVLWTLAYLLMIRQGFVDRTYGMPLAAPSSTRTTSRSGR